jgi:periplasmic protein TonB
MFDSGSLVTKTDRSLVGEPSAHEQLTANDTRQGRLMVIALTLLLAVLGLAIYANRDFWFQDTQEADSNQPADVSPAAPVQPSPLDAKAATPAKPKHRAAPEAKPATPETASGPVAATATTNRTVLPPLEVEVVAGDHHSRIRPGTDSVRVDLQPGAPTQNASDTVSAGSPSKTAAAVTNDAAERVQMSADTSEVVSRPVRPGYPLLARQMKVQGSVILQALISKDGVIQDLRVISGPPILAIAAQTAVRQWRFKPHFQGSEAVETQAKITVNFTISTN